MTQEVPINNGTEHITIYLENNDTNIDCIVKDTNTNKQIKPRDREYAKKYAKEYYTKNKQKIRQTLAARITCDCGKVLTRHGLIQHKKKKIHKERMKTILRNKFKTGESTQGVLNLDKAIEEDDVLEKLIKILKI
ncbi:MAG TPA: hypothetical protein VN703_06615 [Candidatus Sulfopaludibacter sp.]|nr:hypothetical protein [Candidatus Sulfopaludibacter sp.]